MNYYEDQFKDGKKFEQFVINELKNIGINLTLTKTKEEQINIGETYEGYEIKYDKKYCETKNIWIEVEERTDPDKDWVKSGILRNDNTIKYVIGDYDRIFIFLKETLKSLYGDYEIQTNNMNTSKGFLLSNLESIRYSELIIDTHKNNEKYIDEVM
jgi:hypothetical protein